MRQTLELLAPARTAGIGIAAVDCGADAVYIAGPSFGARQAAGNSVEDIRELCEYAHRFGVRIFVTLNTIIYNNELDEVRRLVRELDGAGVDALIIQDPAVLSIARETSSMAFHASTQCAIGTVEKARFVESLGYDRLVLERQMSLERIREIRRATSCELEFFVHGALCVCYSGQCYMSEHLCGRSANRGACIQACRSLYDLEDESGKLLVKNKALLSLKDYNLIDRLEELAEAGVCSFKIEGRLKREAYVKNVVSAYSSALDALVEAHPERYARASLGRVHNAFQPDLSKAFNRGYTSLFLDGERGRWSSMDAPSSIGTAVGTVTSVKGAEIGFRAAGPDVRLSNGDGFAFIARDGSVHGFRGDVCTAGSIRCNAPVEGIKTGMTLYRSSTAEFEKRVDASHPRRLIDVKLDVVLDGAHVLIEACTEDGRAVRLDRDYEFRECRNPEKMLESVYSQLQKTSSCYDFKVASFRALSDMPFFTASELNAMRRSLAEELDSLKPLVPPMYRGRVDGSVRCPKELTYRENVANDISRSIYEARGAETIQPAYELEPVPGAELMRTKYCIRHELGLCPRQGKAKKAEPLLLTNQGRRFRLDFDCAVCEMTLKTTF